jgi:putative addiction module killer protein
MGYNGRVIEIRKTEAFNHWLEALRDKSAKAIIAGRIQRISLGNFGDSKPVGDGVSELRIDFGPGYRVYFTKRGKAVVILLCGGDKATQKRDIAQAKRIAETI